MITKNISYPQKSCSLLEAVLNLLSSVSFHAPVNFLVRSFSTAIWMRQAFLLWSMLLLCSLNTFFRVENEFLHVAVDAPKVRLTLSVFSTVGMAARGSQYLVKMSCVVQFLFDWAISSCRNCCATANSASFISVPVRSSSGLTLFASRKSSLPGCKVHRASTSWLFLTLNLAFISPTTASRVLKYSLLHPVLSSTYF